MPVIDGKVQRARFTRLSLKELSSVDNPAQPGATMAIMKRADPDRDQCASEVAKYICETDGAHTFAEVLRENKFSQEVWPCVDALSQSIRSIVGDQSLTGGEREAKIRASTEQFLSAVEAISPEVSKQLSELCRKREGPMPKTVEELQAELDKANGNLTAATERADTEKARADKAEADLTAERTAHETTKGQLVAATEETIKVGEVEIKKSVVGPEQFAMAKALADERDLANLEKRAATEYPHVVGTTAEKAQVLKMVDSRAADDPVRKSFEAIISSAEKMAAQGFESLGAGGGASPTQKAAQGTFDQKVNEIAKRDGIARHAAMSKARSEFPAEYEAAYGEQDDSARA